ncbi:MAG TPA: nicotinamide-nucleotide amidohydrolase family protein [Candidatus Acetothermia bacterium]|nr:nicotinamide-nucleotide amidohydrolase family protein [Candidatus Acetothermia bacterium]
MNESEVGRLLLQHGRTLAVAESCTGGLLAQRITDVPGASAYFRGGIVAYSNEVKENLLGVPREILTHHGAVSAPCAQAMAQGARGLLGADFGLATTGIAGPGGGTAVKPVGLVYVALASPDGVEVEEHRFRGSRNEVRWTASEAALALLLRKLREL